MQDMMLARGDLPVGKCVVIAIVDAHQDVNQKMVYTLRR